jgi:transposase
LITVFAGKAKKSFLVTGNMTGEQKRIKELEAEVASLKGIINDLLERINRLQNRKNSNNSSIPPSKDENRPRRIKSLREPSGRKPGGQKGHEGSTLQMVDAPDVIIEHKPESCAECGASLSDDKMPLLCKRQVIDLPPVNPMYTEHRVYSARCTCGHITKSEFPTGINSPVSYGENTEALVAYLYSRQYLPSHRMQELLRDVYGLPISEGSIFNILGRFVQKSEPVYEAIRQKTGEGKVTGSDETWININGKMNWGWTWQTKETTFITISSNRGIETINSVFEKGLPNAVLVHDCWKPHFKTGAAGHQLCLAHLLRELKHFEERFSYPWPTGFRKLLIDALELKKELTRVQYFYPLKERDEIEKRLHVLLEEELPPGMKDMVTFQNRMWRYKDYLFTFLYHPDVPPDNNASERAIRNLKVKQKISGQFKSSFGAQCFAMIRSITDTCLKNDQNVLNALKLIAQS